MSEVGEGLGSAIEGGLLARAVEPEAGEGKGWNETGTCLNCGAQLLGPHCHQCGQKAKLHRTIGAFMHDLLHGALHFEGKIWHTLPQLIFKPGHLTRSYIDGHRARHVSPMALFLFSVFLMFATFQVLGLKAPTDISNGDEIQQGLGVAQEQLQAQREELQQQLEALPANDPEHATLEKELESIDQIVAVTGSPTGEADDQQTLTVGNTGISWIDEGIAHKWRENPSLMLYKLQSNGYKFSWLLIPISIPFVWLLFAWKRRFKAYDHAIFVTYSLSFITLLFVLLSVLGKVGLGGTWIAFAALLVPPIHMYKQLRGTYELSRFSAVWRLAVLLVFILVILLLFLQALILLGAF